MRKLMGLQLATHIRRSRADPPVIASGTRIDGVWAILPTLVGHRVVVINTSPSVAPGLYVRCASEPAVGRIVDFRIPYSARQYVQGAPARMGGLVHPQTDRRRSR
jgi:hypothetical protein